MYRMLSAEELDEVIREAQCFVEKEIRLAHNRGDLESYLRHLGLATHDASEEESNPDVPMVLVIGESEIGQSDLQYLIRTHGPWDESCFKFILDYREVHRFDFSTLKGSTKYTHVMVGPMGHNQRGIPSGSSAIGEMEANPDLYPKVIRLLNSGGELKISRSSFISGIMELV